MQVNPINPAAEYSSVFQPNAEKPAASPAPKSPTAVLTIDKPEPAEELTKLQTALAEQNVSLNFSRDEKSGEIIVKLVDSKTGEAIRQLPTEVSLKLSAVNTKLQGQFINKQG